MVERLGRLGRISGAQYGMVGIPTCRVVETKFRNFGVELSVDIVFLEDHTSVNTSEENGCGGYHLIA